MGTHDNEVPYPLFHMVRDDIRCPLIDMVRERSLRIRNGRKLMDIVEATESEVEELRVEVEQIEQGLAPGTDGVFGEGIDVTLCALDAVIQENPNRTNREILEKVVAKLDKWEKDYSDKIRKDR
jgi:hypothetical protein